MTKAMGWGAKLYIPPRPSVSMCIRLNDGSVVEIDGDLLEPAKIDESFGRLQVNLTINPNGGCEFRRFPAPDLRDWAPACAPEPAGDTIVPENFTASLARGWMHPDEIRAAEASVLETDEVGVTNLADHAPDPSVCICEMRVLMANGCQCGAIKK